MEKTVLAAPSANGRCAEATVAMFYVTFVTVQGNQTKEIACEAKQYGIWDEITNYYRKENRIAKNKYEYGPFEEKDLEKNYSDWIDSLTMRWRI